MTDPAGIEYITFDELFVGNIAPVHVYCECRDEIATFCDGDDGDCKCRCHGLEGET